MIFGLLLYHQDHWVQKSCLKSSVRNRSSLASLDDNCMEEASDETVFMYWVVSKKIEKEHTEHTKIQTVVNYCSIFLGG